MPSTTLTFHTQGMHCTGCEHIIEKSVHKLPGIKQIKADYVKETAEVTFDPEVIDFDRICVVITQKGYRCSLPEEARQQQTLYKKVAGLILGITGIVLIIIIDTKFISQSGIPDPTRPMSYSLLLMLGLLTGFHCVGMCGGFILSYAADAARQAQDPYLPHLLYGTGKTLSYTVIGALFGWVGAVITFTPILRGIAGITAGIFLIIFGLNMLNVFPALRRIRLKVPAVLVRFAGQQTRSHNGPFVIGLLNGLMIACGPLQAMYVMAAGTGSALEGAKMLFTFGFGTLPVLLGFGILTSLISGTLTHQLLKLSAIIVIVLGAVMINRGLILTGTGYDLQTLISNVSNGAYVNKAATTKFTRNEDQQTIEMDVIRSGFTPNRFILRQGVPVKWIVHGKELNDCNNRIVVPKLGLEFSIKPGAQVIEFTPKEAGIIPWSCWMGMLSGQFEVIASTAAVAKPPFTAKGKPQIPSPSTKVPMLPTPNKTAKSPETYTVSAGDTLERIAIKLYGDAKKSRDIVKVNPRINPNKLKIGQTLRLPDISKETLKHKHNEIIARAKHAMSGRWNKRFIAVNCGASPSACRVSELDTVHRNLKGVLLFHRDLPHHPPILKKQLKIQNWGLH